MYHVKYCISKPLTRFSSPNGPPPKFARTQPKHELSTHSVASSGGSSLEEVASEVRSLEQAYIVRGGRDPNLLEQFRELLASVEQLRVARQSQQQQRVRPRGEQFEYEYEYEYKNITVVTESESLAVACHIEESGDSLAERLQLSTLEDENRRLESEIAALRAQPASPAAPAAAPDAMLLRQELQALRQQVESLRAQPAPQLQQPIPFPFAPYPYVNDGGSRQQEEQTFRPKREVSLFTVQCKLLVLSFAPIA